MYARDVPPGQIFYHGTKADLTVGDVLEPGFESNFLEGAPLSWIYFSATLDAATWGAELARGEGRGRIYNVEPTGEFEDDPNLTDKKFAGNKTASYRSRAPLRIVGELDEWEGHPPERLAEMRAFLASNSAKEIIDWGHARPPPGCPDGGALSLAIVLGGFQLARVDIVR